MATSSQRRCCRWGCLLAHREGRHLFLVGATIAPKGPPIRVPSAAKWSVTKRFFFIVINIPAQHRKRCWRHAAAESQCFNGDTHTHWNRYRPQTGYSSPDLGESIHSFRCWITVPTRTRSLGRAHKDKVNSARRLIVAPALGNPDRCLEKGQHTERGFGLATEPKHQIFYL